VGREGVPCLSVRPWQLTATGSIDPFDYWSQRGDDGPRRPAEGPIAK